MLNNVASRLGLDFYLLLMNAAATALYLNTHRDRIAFTLRPSPGAKNELQRPPSFLIP